MGVELTDLCAELLAELSCSATLRSCDRSLGCLPVQPRIVLPYEKPVRIRRINLRAYIEVYEGRVAWGASTDQGQ